MSCYLELNNNSEGQRIHIHAIPNKILALT
jgi:hypothetical protein